jgi:phospholipase C
MLDNVKTIVLLMFENRSFDHMMGHLSLENLLPVNGLKKPLQGFSNSFQGDPYPVYNFRNDVRLPFDLPHECDEVATQLAWSEARKKFTMGGFVKAYAASTGVGPNARTEPMGYFKSTHVPVTSFLARTFCACDNWFCSLPTGTQPNRTFAFSGDTFKHKNINLPAVPIDGNTNLFSWMNRNGVRWRVYHDGLSFFALYPSLWPLVLSSNFRDYEFLASDVKNEAAGSAPEVIIIEPSYQDAPHVGPDRPNDNHAPLAIGWGEDFLRRTYEALASNPARWANTVMVVYYDEHGGFYDHVPPPRIDYQLPDNSFRFESLGPRIPAIIASPLVQSGSVCSTLLDHTSVLQLIAEKFTPGKPYSDTVEKRRVAGIGSVSVALNNPNPQPSPPPPSTPLLVQSVLGASIANGPSGAVSESFEAAALEMMRQYPVEMSEKYPELVQWKTSVDNARKS